MATVYIAVRLITEPGEPEQVIGCWEFEAADWITALDMTYDWLKINRKPTCAYHVYC